MGSPSFDNHLVQKVTLRIKEIRFRNRGKLFYTEFDLDVS